jgi:ABC-type phosphate transport system permease subunit
MSEPVIAIVPWLATIVVCVVAIFMIVMCVKAYLSMKEFEKDSYRMFLEWNPRGETYAEWRKRYGFPLS